MFCEHSTTALNRSKVGQRLNGYKYVFISSAMHCIRTTKIGRIFVKTRIVLFFFVCQYLDSTFFLDEQAVEVFNLSFQVLDARIVLDRKYW